jgi:hypothetical protein
MEYPSSLFNLISFKKSSRVKNKKKYLFMRLDIFFRNISFEMKDVTA